MSIEFNYRAVSAQRKIVRGRIEARDSGEATRRLIQQGLTPISIDRDQGKASQIGSKKAAKMQDKALVIRELAILIRSGVPMADAISSIAQSHEGSPVGAGFAEINSHLRGGGTLHDALKKGRLQFPEYIVQLAAAGEMTGRLAQSLESGADQMDYEIKMAQEMRNALIYPAVLVFSGVAATLIIFVVVVPKFTNMLKSSKGEMPWLSMAVLKLGLFVKTHLFALSLGFFGLLALLLVSLGRAEVRRSLMEQLIKLPILGDWMVQTETGRWAAMFGTLLENRVPIVGAMELSYRGVRVESLRFQFQQVLRDLRGGKTLADSLATTRVIGMTGLNLIRVGERSGELAAMLKTLAGLHETAGRERLKQFLILLEPIAILLIGGVLGTIMIAIMMAITSISTLSF